MNDEKQAAKTIKHQHDITKFLMNFPRKTTVSGELLVATHRAIQRRCNRGSRHVAVYCTHLHLPIQTF